MNAAVQTGLAANGEIGPDAVSLTVLSRVNATREELRHIRTYEPGMVLELATRQSRQHLTKGRYDVVQVDADRGVVELRDVGGRHHTFAPSRLGATGDSQAVQLHERKPLTLYTGDTIRWTANDHQRGLINADKAAITAITPDSVTVVNGTVKIPGSSKVKFPTLLFGWSGGLWCASIFGWASAAARLDGRRWRNSCVGPDVLGQQIGMAAQAITRAIDLDDDGMMQQPVEQRRCDHGAAEDVAPFRKAAVRGEDHRALFIARIDQLEEQVAATGYDREVSDLIDDQERWPAVEPEPFAQGAFALCLRQSADQVGKRNERHAFARLDRLKPKRAGQMAFARARRAQQVNDLGARNKVELSQRHDPGLVERRLEREVVSIQRLHRVDPAHPQRSAYAALLPERQFFEQELFHGLQSRNLTAIKAGDAVIDDLDRTRHLEAHHAGFDPVKQ